jgi:hypothetical protein
VRGHVWHHCRRPVALSVLRASELVTHEHSSLTRVIDASAHASAHAVAHHTEADCERMRARVALCCVIVCRSHL